MSQLIVFHNKNQGQKTQNEKFVSANGFSLKI